MPVSQKELGRRLRSAREASRLTQAEVARPLGVSRSTIAQIELGNRAVTGLELEQLAYLYGRDLREFLQHEFREEDGLVALFRIHPEISEQEDILNVLRDCLALGREVANLESLLGIDRDLGTAAPTPSRCRRESGTPFSRGSGSPRKSDDGWVSATRRSRTLRMFWRRRASGPHRCLCRMTCRD